MKSTMLKPSNDKGNQTILESGTYKGQKVDVKHLPYPGKVKNVDMVNELVTVEIDVPAAMVLESE